MNAVAAVPVPTVTHTEVWAFILLCVFAWVAIKACRGAKLPDPTTLQGYATIANTQGGMILILLALFGGVFAVTMLFVIWALARHFDPQNGLVILLTGLCSGSIGAFNGALLAAMKGQDPKPPVTQSKQITETVSTVAPDPTTPVAPLAPNVPEEPKP